MLLTMTTRCVTRATVALLLLMVGCSKNTGEDPGTSTTPPADGPAAEPPADATTERPSLTRAECEAKGGKVIGDIGDGAIHRPDYTCDSGEPPIGSIRAADGEPIAAEGEVCCP